MVYTDGTVPNSSALHILSFLTASLFALDPADKQWEQHYVPTITELEKLLSGHESSVPGRTLWDLFLKKMWHIDSLCALETFLDKGLLSLQVKTRQELIEERDNGIAPDNDAMRLSHTSPLGAFVRRSHLEFTRLKFDDLITLWTGFVKYRLPTYPKWARKNPSEDHGPIDVNHLTYGVDSGSALYQVVYGDVESDDEEENRGVSVKDAERLIEFQVTELQRLGGRIPGAIRAQIQNIIAAEVSVPVQMYYLNFLDAWRAGDYTSAFDNLHRYFDHTMHSIPERSSYQFALLNLAILHADFECFDEAISAIQEAVAIARESHDSICLNFCLSWMYHFGKAFPEQMREVQSTGNLGNEKEGFAFLKAKAKETNSWPLMSTTLLSEAKLEMHQGESLASILEALVRSAHINLTKNLAAPTGSHMLLQSTLYGRIGAAHLAWLTTEVFRECYTEAQPYDDFLKVTFINSQVLLQKGNYKEAFARMNKVEPEKVRAVKYNNAWIYYSGLLQLQRQICRHDQVAVEHILAQLQAVQLLDADLRIHLALFTIEFKIRQGDYGRAMRLVDEAAHSIQPENFDVYAQIKLLCLKALILEKSGHPERGFSLAMRAANISHRTKVLSCLWESSCTLAAVLIGLREFNPALKLVESVLPQILESEKSVLIARAYSLLVDANMGIASELWTQLGQDSIPVRKEYINLALGYIDCAYDAFEKIEDLLGQTEMMAKKATVMHLTGDLVLANDCAAKYLDLRKRRGMEVPSYAVYLLWYNHISRAGTETSDAEVNFYNFGVVEHAHVFANDDSKASDAGERKIITRGLQI
ncbi:hypothetical protein N7495_009488 [Penicillium taxi]|uniref:uncharacterized protein n=1 Tax=Penicillium taxi TaxID=168475 RepID=UPI002545A4BF|nr:uncharacterized protein N7495_009488 [Penicillium taxi]KAJ5884978.1 hypothetical protein N7495_009488 [Penicillium taxi]